jgi:hypothetical protein
MQIIPKDKLIRRQEEQSPSSWISLKSIRKMTGAFPYSRISEDLSFERAASKK